MSKREPGLFPYHQNLLNLLSIQVHIFWYQKYTFSRLTLGTWRPAAGVSSRATSEDCMSVCLCVYECACVCMHIYLNIEPRWSTVRECVCVCVCVCVCACMYVNVNIDVHLRNVWDCVCVCVCVRVYVCMCVCMYTYVNMKPCENVFVFARVCVFDVYRYVNIEPRRRNAWDCVCLCVCVCACVRVWMYVCIRVYLKPRQYN